MYAVARRPHLAVGVALVGASVIAASTVAPLPDVHLPNIHLPAIDTIHVHLTALANPLEVYAQVFQTAAANIDTLAANTVPGQLLNQVLQNQISSATALAQDLQSTGGQIAAAAAQIPATLATAVNQLTAGDVSGAVNTLLGISLAVSLPATNLLPALGEAITKPLQNLVNVINAFTASPVDTLVAVSGFIAPFISVPAAAAAAVQNLLHAVGTGDLSAVANALVAAPATIIDGLLNGGYGPDLGPLVTPGIPVFAGGLLSSATVVVRPDGSFYVNTGGPLYALQQVLQKIANAIAPPAPASITSVPSNTAATVTLTDTAAPSKTADNPRGGAPNTTGTDTAGTVVEAAGGSPAGTPNTPVTPKDGTESSTAAINSTTPGDPADAAGSTDSSEPGAGAAGATVGTHAVKGDRPGKPDGPTASGAAGGASGEPSGNPTAGSASASESGTHSGKGKGKGKGNGNGNGNGVGRGPGSHQGTGNGLHGHSHGGSAVGVKSSSS